MRPAASSSCPWIRRPRGPARDCRRTWGRPSAPATATASDVFPVPPGPARHGTGGGGRRGPGRTTSARRRVRLGSRSAARAFQGQPAAGLRAGRQRRDEARLDALEAAVGALERLRQARRVEVRRRAPPPRQREDLRRPRVQAPAARRPGPRAGGAGRAPRPRRRRPRRALFHGALRRSEVAAQRWADVDVFDSDPVVVTLRRPADGGGHEDFRTLAAGCAAAVRRLHAATDPAPADPVVGLGVHQINRRFAAACAAAGLEGRRTAHSGRVGLAVELTARGARTPRSRPPAAGRAPPWCTTTPRRSPRAPKTAAATGSRRTLPGGRYGRPGSGHRADRQVRERERLQPTVAGTPSGGRSVWRPRCVRPSAAGGR